MGRVSDAKERLMKAVLELIWTGSYGNTTIDQICEKAGVKKGSFYYFFDSKADLAVAALDESWQTRRQELDAIFSPRVAPLDRIRKYCDFVYQKQCELKQRCGCVLGCPLFTLGAEICTQETRLRSKIQEILSDYHKYLESAIRDGQSAGAMQGGESAAKARMLFAYFEGLLTQARIQNDTELLREMRQGSAAILGLTPNEMLAA